MGIIKSPGGGEPQAPSQGHDSSYTPNQIPQKAAPCLNQQMRRGLLCVGYVCSAPAEEIVFAKLCKKYGQRRRIYHAKNTSLKKVELTY